MYIDIAVIDVNGQSNISDMKHTPGMVPSNMCFDPLHPPWHEQVVFDMKRSWDKTLKPCPQKFPFPCFRERRKRNLAIASIVLA